ncbi:MAG: hypothetical protein QOK40_2862 [Miltoncostaeaceae bacterium]|nr:hypothetical protein [Miltoncostaeaceae bacterium]
MRAEVALYAPARAAVLLEPMAGRWPEHEPGDRLALAAGVLAHSAQRSTDAGWATLAAALGAVARGLVAAAGGPLPGDLVPMEALGGRGLLAVVPWEGPGRPRIRAELVSAAVEATVVLRDPPPKGGRTLPVAALALMVALGADADADARLALALAIEGLLGWYQQSHRLTGTRQASAYALVHAAERLSEAGRPVPPGLG